jgi:hypothetical protein
MPSLHTDNSIHFTICLPFTQIIVYTLLYATPFPCIQFGQFNPHPPVPASYPLDSIKSFLTSLTTYESSTGQAASGDGMAYDIIMRNRELGCNSEHETYVGGSAAGRARQLLSEVPEKRNKLAPQVGRWSWGPIKP